MGRSYKYENFVGLDQKSSSIKKQLNKKHRQKQNKKIKDLLQTVSALEEIEEEYDEEIYE